MRFSPGCACCGTTGCVCAVPCTACGTQIRVVIADVVDDTCTDCDTLWNGTFVCDINLTLSSNNACYYEYTLEDHPCTSESEDTILQVALLENPGDEFAVYVQWRSASYGFMSTWIKEYGASTSPRDCTTFSSESIPHWIDGDSACDGTGSTCEITSL